MSKYVKNNRQRDDTLFWKIGIAIIWLYLAAAFPGTKLFGSFPMQRLSLLLLLGHGAITIAYKTVNGIYSTNHVIWYGVFTVISFLSLALSGGTLDNGDFYSILICFTLTFIQAFYITNKQAFKSICWCYIIVCLLNTIVLFADKSLILKNGERLGDSIHINPNTLATYLMYGVLYAIWMLLTEAERKKKIILFGIIVLISYPLVLTGGRKFFIAPLIFFVVSLVLKTNPQKGNARIKVIIIIGASLALIWYLVMNIPALYSSLGNRLEGLLNSYTGRGDTESSVEARKQLRQLAIQGWLDSPIWGNGFDTFKYYSVENGLPMFYSHCNLTELLFNGGIISFCAYYSFFGMILWKCLVNDIINKEVRSCCIAAIIMQVFFDYGGVSYNMYDTQLFILMVYSAMDIFIEKNADNVNTMIHSEGMIR